MALYIFPLYAFMACTGTLPLPLLTSADYMFGLQTEKFWVDCLGKGKDKGQSMEP